MCLWNWTTVWSVDWMTDAVTDAGVRDPRPLCVSGTGCLCGLLTGGLMLLLILLSQIPDLYVCLELDDCVVC